MGWIARLVARRTGYAFVKVAELAEIIDADVHDGDNDFRATEAAVSKLKSIAVYGSMTQWEVGDGNYTLAKKAAERLPEDTE